MSKGKTIKTGGGSNILSPVYAGLGSLPKKGLARSKPIRGEKQRKH